MFEAGLRRILRTLLASLLAITVIAVLISLTLRNWPDGFQGDLALAFFLGTAVEFIVGMGATGLASTFRSVRYVRERVQRSAAEPFLPILIGMLFLGLAAWLEVSPIAVTMVFVLIGALALLVALDLGTTRRETTDSRPP